MSSHYSNSEHNSPGELCHQILSALGISLSFDTHGIQNFLDVLDFLLTQNDIASCQVFEGTLRVAEDR
jgi:hypothetical protein